MSQKHRLLSEQLLSWSMAPVLSSWAAWWFASGRNVCVPKTRFDLSWQLVPLPSKWDLQRSSTLSCLRCRIGQNFSPRNGWFLVGYLTRRRRKGPFDPIRYLARYPSRDNWMSCGMYKHKKLDFLKTHVQHIFLFWTWAWHTCNLYVGRCQSWSWAPSKSPWAWTKVRPISSTPLGAWGPVQC